MRSDDDEAKQSVLFLHKERMDMKKYKNGFFHMGVIGGFSALTYWVVLMGAQLEQGRNIVNPSQGKGPWAEFIDALVHNL